MNYRIGVNICSEREFRKVRHWLPAFKRELERAKDFITGPVLCSDCFSDCGLRMEAKKIGRYDWRRCPNCRSKSGSKLYPGDLEPVLVEFFWNGSFSRADFGGAHRLVSNPFRYGEREVSFPEWLRDDAHLLEDRLRVGLFHYGPPLWRLGEVEPLVGLRVKRTRASAVKKILSAFPERILKKGTLFYRIRKNLTETQESDLIQYDSAPRERTTFGRLDSRGLSVLYGSEDLEICIHECRVLIPDECFVAVLRPNRDLRLLELTAEPLEDGQTPFESLEIAMRYLFAAEEHGYKYTRAISHAAKASGFDGIYYPSYFSLVKPERVPNIALFGFPIQEKIVEVECINRAMLRTASYEMRMGPIFA